VTKKKNNYVDKFATVNTMSQKTTRLTKADFSNVCGIRSNIQTADDALNEVYNNKPVVLLSWNIVVSDTSGLVNHEGEVNYTSTRRH